MLPAGGGIDPPMVAISYRHSFSRIAPDKACDASKLVRLILFDARHRLQRGRSVAPPPLCVAIPDYGCRGRRGPLVGGNFFG